MKRPILYLYLPLTIVLTTLAGFLGNGSEVTDAQMLVMFASAILWYWLPLMVALHRETRNATFVGIVNLLAGWTGIGWIVALALALIGRKD